MVQYDGLGSYWRRNIYDKVLNMVAGLYPELDLAIVTDEFFPEETTTPMKAL